MPNDLHLEAPWVGQSDWDYLGWETEEESEKKELAYDDYIDKLIDEKREEAWYENRK